MGLLYLIPITWFIILVIYINYVVCAKTNDFFFTECCAPIPFIVISFHICFSFLSDCVSFP
jgi:hypothetical protein